MYLKRLAIPLLIAGALMLGSATSNACDEKADGKKASSSCATKSKDKSCSTAEASCSSKKASATSTDGKVSRRSCCAPKGTAKVNDQRVEAVKPTQQTDESKSAEDSK